ncbi:MAG: peptidyl-prolyl cis-trans isomerase [Gemmatimonas sp.]
MLQSLREHASSWLFRALLGFLIVSFGIWGIGDIFLGDRDPVVAKVGGVSVTASQLNQAFREEISRIQAMVPEPLDNDKAKQLGLLDQALGRIEDRILFTLGTRDLGIVISDDVLRQEIGRERAFQNTLGQFDPNVFRQVLAASGYTEASFLNQMRLDLATARLSSAVTASVPVPSQMLDSLYRYHAEQRVAEYVSIPKSEAGNVGTPSDEELQSFFAANAAQFTAPEIRSAVVLRLDPAAIADNAKVGDDRVKQEYDSHIDDFTVKDRRDVEQAVFPDEAQANEAAKLVASGKSLADAARDASGGRVNAVKLGMVERSDLLGDIAGPAFEQKPGTVSKPLKSALGWHLVRVNREEKGRVQPLGEVAAQIRKDIALREAQDSLYSLSNQIEDSLAGGASLDETGKRLGLPVQSIPQVDARGMDRNGKPTAIANDQQLLRVVFQTPEGQESQLADIGNGAYAVVRVTQVTPPQVRPLDEIKGDVVAAWQNEKRAGIVRGRADAILGKLKGGQSLADVAKAEKLTVKTTPSFSRSTHDSETGLPLSLQAQIFSLKQGEAAVGESPDAFVVARVKEIKTPDAAKDPAVRNQIAESLSRSVSADLMDEFVAGLRDRYTVTVNRDVLATRF